MGLFQHQQGKKQKLSKRFGTAQIAGQAIVCQYCGASSYECREIGAQPAPGSFSSVGSWLALLCTGCGWVQQFATGSPYDRSYRVQITFVPLKDGAHDSDGPAGLDLSAI